MATVSFIVPLGRKQADLFIGNNTGWMEFLVTCDGVKSIMCAAYRGLTLMGELKTIEFLDLDEKSTVWNMAKDIAKERLNEAELIRVCRCLLALEYYLNE